MSRNREQAFSGDSETSSLQSGYEPRHQEVGGLSVLSGLDVVDRVLVETGLAREAKARPSNCFPSRNKRLRHSSKDTDSSENVKPVKSVIEIYGCNTLGNKALSVAADESETYNPCVPHWGDEIRRLRKERKLTQKQLGDLAGEMALDTVNRAEGGENSTLETIERIARALGVSMARLFPDPARDVNQQPPWWDNPRIAVLLDLFRQLEAEDQNLVIEQLQRMVKLTRRAARAGGGNLLVAESAAGYPAPSEPVGESNARRPVSKNATTDDTRRRRQRRRRKA